MRVALIGAEFEENLAVRYLWGSLEAAGHEVVPIVFNRAEDTESAARQLQASGTGLAGFSMVYDFSSGGDSLNSTRTSNLLPGRELNSISVIDGAASAVPENKLNTRLTKATRQLVPHRILPFPTALVPCFCFLIDMAVTHDLGLDAG